VIQGSQTGERQISIFVVLVDRLDVFHGKTLVAWCAEVSSVVIKPVLFQSDLCNPHPSTGSKVSTQFLNVLNENSGVKCKWKLWAGLNWSV